MKCMSKSSNTPASISIRIAPLGGAVIMLNCVFLPVSCSKMATLKAKASQLFGANEGQSKTPAGDSSINEKNTTLSYFSAQKTTISDSVTFDGKLEASEKIEIRADKRLRLGPAKFKVADRLKRGDVLFVVDTKELEQKRTEARERVEQLKVDIKSSKAQFEFAGKQLERKTGLVKKGIVAQKELEEAEKAFVAAESDLKTKELEIRKAERELVSANEGVTSANIVSPIDGIISTIVPGGDEVNQGQSLAVIANPIDLAMTGQVDELNVTKIKVGQSVQLSLDALKGNPVSGVVKSIEASQQRGGAMNSYSVKVEIPQDVVKKNDLRVGYAAKVSAVFGVKENAVVIPRAALKQEGDQYFVLVADAVGKIPTARSVILGLQTDLEAEVTRGLKPGEVVAVATKLEGAQP